MAQATPTTPTADKKANDRYVAITLTPELAAALDKARGDTSRGLHARELVAKALGVTITIDRHAPKKYANEAEKKAAQTKSRLNRAEAVKLLKKQHQLKMAGKKAEADALDAKITELLTA